MSNATLIAHCGARMVRREDLDAIVTPPPTDTWYPIGHATVVETVGNALTNGGFQIRKSQFAVSRENARLFATMDLATPLAGGEVTLAVGIRNSLDKSLPLGFCAGNRVFCCDNLAFRSDLLVSRKHTRFGMDRFKEAICQAVRSLGQFQQAEAARIKRFQYKDVSDTQAESVILRSYERGIVSHRLLPQVIKEWRQPSFEDFQARTYWSLENAFTTVLGHVSKSNPQRFCALSISLQGLLGEAAGLRPEEMIATTAA